MSAAVRRGLDRIGWDWVAAVLAVVLAAFVVIGASFKATNTAAWFAASPGAVVGSLLAGLFLAAFLYLGLVLLFAWLDRRWDAAAVRTGSTGMPSMRQAVRRWLLPTWAALLAGWLPWLIVHYPGNIDSDTVTQLFEWLKLSQRSDHHPWFDTMVFGWFFSLGHALGSYSYGLFLIVLLIELATALGFALVIAYLARLGLPTRARWLLTAAVAVFPVFFTTPSVLSKDSFAGVFWIPFLVVFTEALRTRVRVLMRPWVGIGTLVLMIPLILAQRPNFYLVMLCVVVLLLVSARGTRWRLIAGSAVVVVITNVLWPMVVLPAWHVKPGSLTDMLTIPVQQTARTVKEHGSSLPASERRAINAVLRYDGLAKAYVPTRSDNVKGRWNGKATRSEELAYLKVWVVEGFRYPGTYAAATINNTFEYFTPVTPIDFQNNLNLSRYIDFWHSRAFKTTTREQIVSVVDELHTPTPIQHVQHSWNMVLGAVDASDPLASKALYCSWIPLLALAMGLRRRSWFHALATMPVFINLLILIAGPIALPRYMIPSIYGCVLLIGLTLVPVRWEPRQLSAREGAEGVPSSPPEGANAEDPSETSRPVGAPASPASEGTTGRP